MGRGAGGDQCDVADRQRADAVLGEGGDAELLLDLGDDRGQHLGGLRVGGVVEALDALTLVVVAHDALEEDDRTIGVTEDGGAGALGVQRGVEDLGVGHDRSLTNAHE